MAIVAGDIEFRLSGGASNTDPNASLGGAKSSAEVVDAQLHNLFAKVTGAESAAGSIKYRCIYVHNGHGTITWESVKAFIQSNTPSPGTALAIGLGTSAVNATEQTVADEDTAPSGVTFSAVDDYATGIALGDLPAGEHRAIWLRRTVTAGASAYNNDGATIQAEGDTAA
jgi:hypothetical protein